MKNRRLSLFLVLVTAVLLCVKVSGCTRKAAESGGKGAPTRGYTPVPIPPTPTLFPGQPTRLPSLPG